MNEQTDIALLRKYSATQDAEAFKELGVRYGRLVYGTCLRVLNNADDAEDVSQECFLELARKAGCIDSSLPGWLHKVATDRSIDRIRCDARRRRREEIAAVNPQGAESQWDEIAPCVDEALEMLPENLRLPVVYHFLQGFSHRETAGLLGVNQSTVSRSIAKAITLIRAHLRDCGLIVSTTLLLTCLVEKTCVAVPASLSAGLGKMALAGIGGSATDAGTSVAPTGTAALLQALSTLFGTLAGKAVVISVAASLVAGAVFIGLGNKSESPDEAARAFLTALSTGNKNLLRKYVTPPVVLDNPRFQRSISAFRGLKIISVGTPFQKNGTPNYVWYVPCEFRYRSGQAGKVSLAFRNDNPKREWKSR